VSQEEAATVGTSTAPEPVNFGIRPGVPSDHAFVVDTWAHGISPAARALLCLGFGGREDGGEDSLFAVIKRGAYRALLRADLRIAHLAGEVDAILGWSIRNGAGGRFVYVRHGVRSQGIERALS
jgi:hypothetical protein